MRDYIFLDVIHFIQHYNKKVSFNKMKITKGRASDLIGMEYSPEDEDLELLKFFKIPTLNKTQTHAKHETALIFQDEQKAKLWNDRPPSSHQKEFFRFFGIKLVKGTTCEQAKVLIRECEGEMTERDDPKLDDWESYESIIYDLSDPDFRECNEIKKPSASLIRQAISELYAEGESYQYISDEIDVLIERLVKLKPDIRRA